MNDNLIKSIITFVVTIAILNFYKGNFLPRPLPSEASAIISILIILTGAVVVIIYLLLKLISIEKN